MQSRKASNIVLSIIHLDGYWLGDYEKIIVETSLPFPLFRSGVSLEGSKDIIVHSLEYLRVEAYLCSNQQMGWQSANRGVVTERNDEWRDLGFLYFQLLHVINLCSEDGLCS